MTSFPNPRIERPWSQLPIELLSVVSGNLTEISDYVAFRSVCSSWRSAASLDDLPPQRPRLILPYDPLIGVRSFYNLANGKLSTFDFPECRNKFVCGSSHGWLALIADDSSVSLWNPITRSQIPLPPPNHFPYYLGQDVPGCDVREGYPWKVFLSSNPTDPTADCIVVVILALSRDFVYCRPGDDTWTILDKFLPCPVNSMVFHERRIYAFLCDLAMDEWACAVVDLDPEPFLLPVSIPQPYAYVMISGLYLLNASAELFVVFTDAAYNEDFVDVEKMEVFRLDLDGELKWSRVRSIGDLAFFLAWNHCSAVRAPDFPGCKPDCVYFSYRYYRCGRPEPGVYGMDIFSMKENDYEYQSFMWEETGRELRNSTWFTPSLR